VGAQGGGCAWGVVSTSSAHSRFSCSKLASSFFRLSRGLGRKPGASLYTRKRLPLSLVRLSRSAWHAASTPAVHGVARRLPVEFRRCLCRFRVDLRSHSSTFWLNVYDNF
jgi:hypothetical protein